MAVQPPPEKTMDVPTYPVWRLSVEQYHQLIDAGILIEGDPVELLEGWLITKLRKTRRHSHSTHMIYDLFEELTLNGFHVETQDAITLADSEPEPDGMIVKGEVDDY